MQRLLHREHDPGLDRVDVGREVRDEVLLRHPGEALLVNVEMRQGGTPRSLRQQGADRLALVQAERGDVDQADDVGRVRAERGDDLAAVGMPGNDGRPVLASQDPAQPGDIVGQPGQRDLGCGDAVAVCLQVLDDGAPTGPVGSGAVDEDDVGHRSHVRAPSGCTPGRCTSLEFDHRGPYEHAQPPATRRDAHLVPQMPGQRPDPLGPRRPVWNRRANTRNVHPCRNAARSGRVIHPSGQPVHWAGRAAPAGASGSSLVGIRSVG